MRRLASETAPICVPTVTSTSVCSYEPEAIGNVWLEHRRCALARLAQIGYCAVPFAARLTADLVGDRVGSSLRRALRSAPSLECEEQMQERARAERHARRAVELRLMLTELGPTFIKFGQMLSIRPDVIPPAAIYELQKLCDSVPSFPTPLALDVVRRELGCDPCEVFDGLAADMEPIAAASLGQVASSDTVRVTP